MLPLFDPKSRDLAAQFEREMAEFETADAELDASLARVEAAMALDNGKPWTPLRQPFDKVVHQPQKPVGLTGDYTEPVTLPARLHQEVLIPRGEQGIEALWFYLLRTRPGHSTELDTIETALALTEPPTRLEVAVSQAVVNGFRHVAAYLQPELARGEPTVAQTESELPYKSARSAYDSDPRLHCLLVPEVRGFQAKYRLGIPIEREVLERRLEAYNENRPENTQEADGLQFYLHLLPENKIMLYDDAAYLFFDYKNKYPPLSCLRVDGQSRLTFKTSLRERLGLTADTKFRFYTSPDNPQSFFAEIVKDS